MFGGKESATNTPPAHISGVFVSAAKLATVAFYCIVCLAL